MKLLRMALIVALAVGSTACFDMFKNSSTRRRARPRPQATVRSYLGTWAGPAVDAGRAELRRPAVEDHVADGKSGERRFRGHVRRWCQAGGHAHGHPQRHDHSLGRDGNGDEGRDDLPVQHDRHRHVSGHVEHPRELRRHVVPRPVQRLGNHQAIVTSLFR